MTDEDVVLNGHALAHKRVTRDLAAFTNTCILLDFNKRANLGLIADLTAIKIDKSTKLDITSQSYTWRDRAEFVHRRINCPFFWMDSSAASSIRTTRKPAWPSLKGVLLFMTQSAK